MAYTGTRLPSASKDNVSALQIQYSEHIRFQSDQEKSILLDLVSKDKISPGALDFRQRCVKRLVDNTNGLTKKATRFTNTTAVTTENVQRIMSIDTYVRKEEIRAAEIGTIGDPTWNILKVTSSAFQTKIDQTILASAIAAVPELYIDGSGVTQLSSTAFTTGQTMYDTNKKCIDLNRINTLEALFRTNKVNPVYEKIFLVVHPYVMAFAKDQEKFISRDYREEYPVNDKLVLPKINNVVILDSPEIGTTTIDGVTYYENVAFTMEGLVFGSEEEYTVDLLQESALDGDYNLITKRGFSCIRVDDGRVVKFLTVDPTAAGITA